MTFTMASKVWCKSGMWHMQLAEKIKCKPLFINRYYLENINYNAKKSFYSLKGAVNYILDKNQYE